MNEFCLLSFVGKEKRRNLSSYSFLIYVGLMSFSKAIGLDRTNQSYLVLGAVAGVFALLSILLNDYSFREYILMLLSGVFTVVVFYTTHQFAPVCLYLLLWAAKRANENKTAEMMFCVWLSGFILVVGLALAGVIPNNIRYDDIHGTMRYAMGYKKDNAFQMTLFIVVSLWGYVVKKKKVWMYVILLLVDYLAFKMSDSRAGFCFTLLAIIAWAVMDFISNRPRAKRVLNKTLNSIWFVPMVLSLLAILWRNSTSDTWRVINRVLNNRLFGIQIYYNDLTPKLFGQIVETKIINGYVMVFDNAYAYMLLQYGVVYMFLFIALYAWFFVKHNETHLEVKVVALLMLSYGLVEQFIQNCFMNYSLVLICILLWKEKNKKDLEQ